MEQTFIPFKASEHTLESYIPTVKTRSQLIYISVLALLIICGAALPLIHVNVTTAASGLIQAQVEKQDIIAPTGGYIRSLALAENKYISKGSTLFTIDESGVKKQEDLNSGKLAEYQAYVRDIRHLLGGGSRPSTPNYQISLQQYNEQLQDARTRLDKAKVDYDRNVQLLKEKVIAPAEFENVQLSYRQALSAYQMVIQKQRTQWQADELNYREQLRSLQSSSTQLAEDRKKYTVHASIAGNVQQLLGIQSGSYVTPGQKIGEISPDSGMIVQCFVAPSNIGLIKKDQSVFLQVDAFNYNEWGLLRGRVIDISNDITLVGSQQQPAFKVRCSIEKNYLELKNGYRGYLHKGMSVQARFVIAHRSLFQLLYDKTDSWLNPARHS